MGMTNALIADMNTLDELKQFFKVDLHESLEQWYREFQQDTQQTRLDLFIVYLSQRNLITSEKLFLLRGAQPVHLTDTETLAAGFADAVSLAADHAMAPIESAPTMDVDSIPELGSRDDLPIDSKWGELAPASRSLNSMFFADDAGETDRTIIHNDTHEPPDTQDIADKETESLRLDDAHSAESAFTETPNNPEIANPLQIEDENHELKGELGRGAMGIVFLAQEKKLGRKVAFKQIRPEAAAEHELMMRFLREAQITAQLDHPAIIPVHALIKGFKGLPGYTMKVVDGVTLDVLIRETKKHATEGVPPLPDSHKLSTRLEHFLKVCNAMAYAHTKGVLHRDLKPKNILLGQFGEVYVVDWGLARLMYSKEDAAEDGIHLHHHGDYKSVKTQVGTLMGTPQYMSPEQAQGLIHEMDGRSDLFSLGAILYELVYLEKALQGANLLEVVNKLIRGDLREAPDRSPYERLPQGLPAIIRKATASDKNERYESVKQFSDALHSCMHGWGSFGSSDSLSMAVPGTEPTLTLNGEEEGTSTKAPNQEASKINQWLGWVAAAVVLLIMGGGMFGLQRSIHRTHKRAQEKQKKEQKLILKRMLDTSSRGAELDRLFAHYQGLLQELARATKFALKAPSKPKKKRWRWRRKKQVNHYRNKSFNPPDLKYSPLYRDKISLDWPVTKVAPGKDEKALAPLLEQLSKVRQAQRDVVLHSLPNARSLTEKETRKRLLHKGMPILSSFVALRQGVISLYPGRGSYPKKYDPTKRPWYQSVAGKRDLIWSKPYVSSQRIRAVLFGCMTSVFGEDGQFRGVVGIDVKLNTLAKELETIISHSPWIKEAQILNQDGRMMVGTRRRIRNFTGKRIIKQALQMPLYNRKPILDRIRAGKRSGHLLLKGGEKGLEFVTHTQLRTINWHLVTVSEWPSLK